MTKEELKEYRHIREELRLLDNRRLQWLSRAERSTRAPSKAPVVGGAHDPMPHIVDRLDGIREQADSLAGRLRDAKTCIERSIEQLPSLQRRLMRARYIDGKCWEAISEEMAYSVQRLYQLHKLALSAIKFPPKD
jgi:DNA-directed RNA polymerase specialized sigma24 family protein